ncbi:prolipoprotein diacylglyceryl transferase [Gleimia coleocanis DSM 15436]|uniref:Phosphatidylglycerol--prolipoprotein diacylglyceryl transferase n=1 Tax=Gleimia coleocanis DSM 15436 TaxID=525245 RepID=C0W0L7_9ACTO|nr:prolipoprotein diacylglyceryl transferase [Gleimia coleocanis]EEH64076.1 prolipoprotein diacylglyceryl transferase [Gleimia coleocanis DSM 15436]
MNALIASTIWTQLVDLSIPSPSQGVWYLGPIPFRAYGMIIATGMLVAVYLTRLRYARRGGDPEVVYDVALFAIIFGVLGARLYHVTTNWQPYFGKDGSLIEILYIWHGGLAIMGGVLAGSAAALLVLRRKGLKFGPFADAVAPTILLAQAMGRFGNWFNQELFGQPTTLPWGLEIDDAHLPAGYASGTLFHPTFLYEVLWNLSVVALILYLDKKLTFKGGQVMFLYIMGYCFGRFWIEMIRIEPANYILGVRVNVWAAAVFFAVGAVGFYLAGKRGASTFVESSEKEEKNVE